MHTAHIQKWTLPGGRTIQLNEGRNEWTGMLQIYEDGNCHLGAGNGDEVWPLHVIQLLHPAILSQANLRSPKI